MVQARHSPEAMKFKVRGIATMKRQAVVTEEEGSKEP